MRIGNKHFIPMVMAPQVAKWLSRHLEDSDLPNCPENMLEVLMELVAILGSTVTEANAQFFVPLMGIDRDEVTQSLRCQFIDRLEEAWLKEVEESPDPSNVIQFPKGKR